MGTNAFRKEPTADLKLEEYKSTLQGQGQLVKSDLMICMTNHALHFL